MTADVIKRRRDFLLRKLLDQSEQFLPLHTHDSSVRSKLQHAVSKQSRSRSSGRAGHEAQYWPGESRRAISGPLTPVTSAPSRSLADTPSRRSGCMTGPDGTDSQADSAGSIPVTRSKELRPRPGLVSIARS